jgi:hypothetical protein
MLLVVLYQEVAPVRPRVLEKAGRLRRQPKRVGNPKKLGNRALMRQLVMVKNLKLKGQLMSSFPHKLFSPPFIQLLRRMPLGFNRAISLMLILQNSLH